MGKHLYSPQANNKAHDCLIRRKYGQKFSHRKLPKNYSTIFTFSHRNFHIFTSDFHISHIPPLSPTGCWTGCRRIPLWVPRGLLGDFLDFLGAFFVSLHLICRPFWTKSSQTLTRNRQPKPLHRPKSRHFFVPFPLNRQKNNSRRRCKKRKMRKKNANPELQ